MQARVDKYLPLIAGKKTTNSCGMTLTMRYDDDGKLDVHRFNTSQYYIFLFQSIYEKALRQITPN